MAAVGNPAPVGAQDQHQAVQPEVTTLRSELDSRSALQYEQGEVQSEGMFRLGTTISSFVNGYTVMSGTQRTWTPARLLDGKFKLFREIGGEGVMLNTRTGDQIFGMYFSVASFFESLREMSGVPKVVDFHFDHPFLKTTQNITLENQQTHHEYAAARVTYSPEMEDLFRNPQEFRDFCNQLGLELVWEDTLEPPVSMYSWGPFSSRQRNIVVVKQADLARMKDTGLSEVAIHNRPQNRPVHQVFSNTPMRSRAIVFDGENQEAVKKLFQGDGVENRGLKGDRSSWGEIVQFDGKSYMLENRESAMVLDILSYQNVRKTSFMRVEERPIENLNLEGQGGAVVLSMNQTDSFAAFSHEILTFLFSGVNVMAYDNAGKGLSKGKNSQGGMTQAARSAGDFVTEQKGFPQERVMFKGQCAGGLPTSDVGREFPHSHIWIDQSPQTFYCVAGNAFAAKGDEIHRSTANSQSYTGRAMHYLSGYASTFAPVASYTASWVLPSYDVVSNLRENQGRHIFTIGVPNELGRGGDQLVPESHREAIREQVQSEPNGLYLPMPGARHVTDWWTDPDVLRQAKGALQETHISVDPYALQMAAGRDIIDQKYQDVFGSAFDAARATQAQTHAYGLIERAYTGEGQLGFEKFIEEVKQQAGTQVAKAVVQACMDASEAGGHYEQLVYFMNYGRTKL